MSNPYRNLPDHQFWRKAVSSVEVHRFDPVVEPRFRISAKTRVATAGSCFAQHISRKLAELGCNFFVPEDGSDLPEAERRRRSFGVFSARYGNIYTVAQLRLLFEEAYGRHSPIELALPLPDGRYADLYRQQVEPGGFASERDLMDDRAAHLASVRRVFEDCDIFIFTLGLTEAWRSRLDGSVYSTAPGVVGGAFDPERHEFVNFGVAEVESDLFAFLEGLKRVNPRVKVILTVSPVPLIATYEPRNVLVATTYSKSVLRVAAESAIRRFDWVDYMPSYEIITGSFSGGLYFGDDSREVNSLGVAHAMRSFVANYIEGFSRRDVGEKFVPARPGNISELVCDEEVLESVRF